MQKLNIRVSDELYFGEDLSPEQYLWASVLRTFIDDAKELNQEPFIHRHSYWVNKESLIREAKGPWIAQICDLIDINHESFCDTVQANLDCN